MNNVRFSISSDIDAYKAVLEKISITANTSVEILDGYQPPNIKAMAALFECVSLQIRLSLEIISKESEEGLKFLIRRSIKKLCDSAGIYSLSDH